MKQFFKFFAASLLALVVAGILFFIISFGMIGAAVSSIGKEEPVSIKDNSTLLLDLSQPISDLGQENALAIINGQPSVSFGLYDILKSFREAKNDNRIKGIYIKTGGGSIGWATMQQLRAGLQDFKKSGKFVYAYGDFISQRDYYITSVADSVFINPMGHIELKGLASQITFYKGTMDMLGVEPEIFYCGQFKSATEPFRMQKMSDPNRKQLAALQRGFWDELLTAVSEHTQADTATIYGWVKAGVIQNAGDAIRYKLADGLFYKDEIEDLLKRQSGLKESDKLRLTAMDEYIRTLPEKPGVDQLAVLVAEGEIVDGYGDKSGTQVASDAIIKDIRKVRDNDKIKAVVLRINSPGGSALASENILRELLLLKKKKPLVVSMGDLAASGGYYIACKADSIFAMPNTITGSIGVFGMMFNTQKLFNNKLGITFDTEKNAPYADFPDMNRPMNDMEKRFMQSSVDSIYVTFKQHVAEGRKLDITYVDSIGQGRVWTGKAALDNKLVDAFGNLDRALQSAAAIAKVSNYKVVTYPVVKDKFQQIMELLNNKGDKETLAQSITESRISQDFKWYNTLKTLLNNKNRTWMMMPFIPEVQ